MIFDSVPMDAQGLPIVSPKIDYREVDSISSQRLLCFVNHFQAHTIAFLNAFATSCEQRLAEVNWRIQKTEATLSVLEAKLSSIPGLECVTIPYSSSSSAAPGRDSTADVAAATLTSLPELPRPTDDDSVTREVPLPSQIPSTDGRLGTEDKTAVGLIRAADHPDFVKYFRMLHLGVPFQAVALKCRTENPHLDAAILETPDRWLSAVDVQNAVDDDVHDDDDDDDDSGWSQ